MRILWSQQGMGKDDNDLTNNKNINFYIHVLKFGEKKWKFLIYSFHWKILQYVRNGGLSMLNF
jgi:hypothetical protein